MLKRARHPDLMLGLRCVHGDSFRNSFAHWSNCRY